MGSAPEAFYQERFFKLPDETYSPNRVATVQHNHIGLINNLRHVSIIDISMLLFNAKTTQNSSL